MVLELLVLATWTSWTPTMMSLPTDKLCACDFHIGLVTPFRVSERLEGLHGDFFFAGFCNRLMGAPTP